MSDENVSSNQREADLELVRKAVQSLAEHFETVHVFASRHMPAELDGTACTNQGMGHWHARYGQIREWLIYEDERVRNAARKNDE